MTYLNEISFINLYTCKFKIINKNYFTIQNLESEISRREGKTRSYKPYTENNYAERGEGRDGSELLAI